MGLAAAVVLAVPYVQSQPAGIKWEKNYASALALARKTKKPVLVEFYADWCGPCKQMARTTLQDPAIVKLTRKFVSVRVDLDRQKDLARKYDVQSIPYTVILNPNGKVTRAATGYQDVNGFRLFLMQGLE
jgi:thiol:disulfide interchange protein DsbD